MGQIEQVIPADLNSYIKLENSREKGAGYLSIYLNFFEKFGSVRQLRNNSVFFFR